jgi:hypothetical protein
MSATSKERLLKKLQKLKALAQDPTGNANEAANAAARMTEIMIQEGIAEAELDLGNDGELTKEDIAGGKKLPTWRKNLLGVLAGAVNCRAVAQGANKVWLLGPSAQIAAVTYQYTAVANDVERLQKEWIGAPRGSSEWRSFCVGATWVISKRVQDIRDQALRHAQQAGQTRALVFLQSSITDAETSRLFNGGKLQSGRKERPPEDAHSFVAGMQAGRRVSLGGGSAALGSEKTALVGCR